MNNIKIKTAELSDIYEIEKLAFEIWMQHYVPIIGEEQVRYMIGKYQSTESIKRHISNEGYEYYMAYIDDALAGYCAVQPDLSNNKIFLSKIYVLQDFRNKGIAKEFINYFTCRLCVGNTVIIWLTVNKYNEASIKAYEKLGFHIIKDVVTDIGEGFFMDDFIMECEYFTIS